MIHVYGVYASNLANMATRHVVMTYWLEWLASAAPSTAAALPAMWRMLIKQGCTSAADAAALTHLKRVIHEQLSRSSVQQRLFRLLVL